MSFEDEVRQQKAGINMGEQRAELWKKMGFSPMDPVLTKPTGKLKTVIDEALPSIKAIIDKDSDFKSGNVYRDFSTTSGKMDTGRQSTPDNLIHVRKKYDGIINYRSFDVKVGTMEVDGDTWGVEIWIFDDGGVAYVAKETYSKDLRLFRPEDYAIITYPDGKSTLEDKIAKLKYVEITPEDVGITAEVIRQKILDQVVESQMIIEKREQERTSSKSSKGCYIATAVYGSYDCPEVWVLRRYRDFTLLGNPFGQLFVKIYYTVSPTMVKWFGNTRWFKKFWKERLDRMIADLRSKGISDKPYRD